MSDTSYTTGSTKAGTVGGTLLVLLLHIESGEVGKTMVLAATGAAVSFAVSKLLQWTIREIRRRLVKKTGDSSEAL